MRRFTVGFIGLSLFLICSFGLADEKKYYVIPVEKVSKEQKYSQKDLQVLFENFVKSYDGKAFWGLTNKKMGATEYLAGVALPVKVTDTAENDLAAACYRCGLARADLVKKEDCQSYNYPWGVSSLDALKKACN